MDGKDQSSQLLLHQGSTATDLSQNSYLANYLLFTESVEPKGFIIGTILITLIYHLLSVNISLFPHISIRFVNFLEQIFALTKRKHASEAPFIYYDARTDVAASRYLQN